MLYKNGYMSVDTKEQFWNWSIKTSRIKVLKLEGFSHMGMSCTSSYSEQRTVPCEDCPVLGPHTQGVSSVPSHVTVTTQTLPEGRTVLAENHWWWVTETNSRPPQKDIYYKDWGWLTDSKGKSMTRPPETGPSDKKSCLSLPLWFCCVSVNGDSPGHV